MKWDKLENLQLSRIIEFPNKGVEISISDNPPLYFRNKYHMLQGQVHIGAQVHSENFVTIITIVRIYT